VLLAPRFPGKLCPHITAWKNTNPTRQPHSEKTPSFSKKRAAFSLTTPNRLRQHNTAPSCTKSTKRAPPKREWAAPKCELDPGEKKTSFPIGPRGSPRSKSLPPPPGFFTNRKPFLPSPMLTRIGTHPPCDRIYNFSKKIPPPTMKFFSKKDPPVQDEFNSEQGTLLDDASFSWK